MGKGNCCLIDIGAGCMPRTQIKGQACGLILFGCRSCVSQAGWVWAKIIKALGSIGYDPNTLVRGIFT